MPEPHLNPSEPLDLNEGPSTRPTTFFDKENAGTQAA